MLIAGTNTAYCDNPAVSALVWVANYYAASSPFANSALITLEPHGFAFIFCSYPTASAAVACAYSSLKMRFAFAALTVSF